MWATWLPWRQENWCRRMQWLSPGGERAWLHPHTSLSFLYICGELRNYLVVVNRNKVLGSWGWVMSIAAALSAFGSLNGTFFSGGRVCFVAAREGHMVRNTFERQTILSKPFFSDVSGSFLCQHLCFFSFPSLIFCPWPMWIDWPPLQPWSSPRLSHSWFSSLVTFRALSTTSGSLCWL